MAAKTPDTLTTMSFGSVLCLKGTFSTTNIDDGDTWATGRDDVVAAFASLTSTPTVSGSNIAIVNSTGTLTFGCDKDNLTADIFVLAGFQS